MTIKFTKEQREHIRNSEERIIHTQKRFVELLETDRDILRSTFLGGCGAFASSIDADFDMDSVRALFDRYATMLTTRSPDELIDAMNNVADEAESDSRAAVVAHVLSDMKRPAVTEISFIVVVNGRRTAISYLRKEKIEELLSAKDPLGEFLQATIEQAGAPAGPKQ